MSRAESIHELARERTGPAPDVDHPPGTHVGKVRELGAELNRVPAHEAVVRVSSDCETHVGGLYRARPLRGWVERCSNRLGCYLLSGRGLAQPVVETSLTQHGVFFGDERPFSQHPAEVERLRVGHYLAWVVP